MSKIFTSKVPMTSDEKNALNQIAKLDSRIIDDNTRIRLDTTYVSKDGSTRKRYVLAQGDRVKWEAEFTEKNKKQSLEQIFSVRRKQKLDPAPKNKSSKAKVQKTEAKPQKKGAKK